MSNRLLTLRGIPCQILEVERKFNPTAESIKLIRSNAGSPAFRKFEPLGSKQFEDTYYDHRSALLSKGIWLRRRNHVWEAKISRGGDFVNSRFEELIGVHDISEMLRKHTNQARIDDNGDYWGLEEIAKFGTIRQAWKLNECFEVMLDQASFGHVVGEVELICSVYGDQNLEQRKVETMELLDGKIKQFMKHHTWAFPTGNVKGKLSAYFEWLKEQKASEDATGQQPT